MTAYQRSLRPHSLGAVIGAGCLIGVLASPGTTSAQVDSRRGPPGCVPVAERQIERGCYILVSDPLGELPARPLHWHIDVYPSRAAAEAGRETRGTVVEALGRVWLMSIAEAGYRARGGEHVAEIGPLPTTAGMRYTASYMEGVMLPGVVTGVHRHRGPEAIHTLTGEECMETPAGKSVGRPGGPPIVVPAGVPHRLSINGAEERRSLALVLHDSSQPWVIRTHEHAWTPKGLCGDG
jgi:quercetin dioxygenase-like cupin family protein